MKIGIASDHRGYELKNNIIKTLDNYEFIDYGTKSKDSVDYTDYAFLLGTKVANKEVDFGIAICGSGIGISIACNKVKKIRCAKISSLEEARITRIDNDANIMALSANTNIKDAIEYIKIFIETPFSNIERHQRRIDKITAYEEEHEC